MPLADDAVTGVPSDRALQDDVIRALADASYRASAEWRNRRLADPDRVERYATFLARHFYYERIVHFFKYSRALARVTGRRPEAILRRPGFDALRPTLVLGSRETARAVARLVVEHVAQARAPIVYLPDLLRYEAAMMVTEAGPRVWRSTGTGERAPRSDAAPETVEGTVLLTLEYDLPIVLSALLQPGTEPPRAPKRPTSLLLARSPEGRVTVARSDAASAALVQLADGKRTMGELAAEAGLGVHEVEETVRGLVELGALRFSTGS